MFSILEIDRGFQDFISKRRNRLLTQGMIGFTSLGSFPAALVIGIYIYVLGNSAQFKTFFHSLLLAALVIQITKYFSSRKRPENQVIKASFSSSFPSGHSASAFVLATVFSSFYPSLTIISYVIAAVVAFSRVYLGEHFISDVLVGSTVGISSALIIISLT